MQKCPMCGEPLRIAGGRCASCGESFVPESGGDDSMEEYEAARARGAARLAGVLLWFFGVLMTLGAWYGIEQAASGAPEFEDSAKWLVLAVFCVVAVGWLVGGTMFLMQRRKAGWVSLPVSYGVLLVVLASLPKGSVLLVILIVALIGVQHRASSCLRYVDTAR